MKKIAVSILSSVDADKDLLKLEDTDMDFLHVDVMDGRFVNNTSNPFPYVRRFASYTKKEIDVHLMEEDPRESIHKYALVYPEFITIHVEISKDISSLLKLIHGYGIKAGIALNPDTDIQRVLPYLDQIDLILIMSVFPGYGGQSFIESSIEKVEKLKTILVNQNRNILLSIDGGIKEEQAKQLSMVDILVSGSYVVNSNNFQEKISTLR